MEKSMIWFLLLLKAQLKKPLLWVQLFAMAFLAFLVSVVTLPTNENTIVLIYNEGGMFEEPLMEALEHKESVFTFQRVGSRESLKEAVLTGNADSGFIIKEGMEEKLKRKNQVDIVEHICSSASTKGSVARETFYSVFYESYSVILLEQSLADIFVEANDQTLDKIKDRNSYYIKSSEVFDVIYETVPAHEKADMHEPEVYPIKGLVGIIIFLNMLMARGEDFYKKGGNFLKYLPRQERPFFLFLKYIAASAMEGAFGILLYVLFHISDNVFYEIAKMLFFLAICAVWVIGFGRLFRKSAVYFGWVFTLVASNLVLAPVFFDLGNYMPAVRVLNWLFPVGIYLKL